MANPYSSQFPRHLEHDVCDIDGYIALDGSSNVVGLIPTQSVPVSGKAYTLLKGASNTLPVHTSTGVYTITLDEPWLALLMCDVNPGWTNHSVASSLNISPAGINVTGSQSGSMGSGQPVNQGNWPGTDPNTAPQTIVVHVTNASGALTDPPANTGIFVRLRLKRAGTQ